MTTHAILDERLRRPYSIGTGIPKGGDAEIEGYLESLRVQGFCGFERVVPEDRVGEVRESVVRGRQLLEKDRQREREKRVESEQLRLAAAANGENSADIEVREPVRAAVVVRYGPWWLSGNEFGNMHSGGRTIRTYVPKEVYERFSPDLQLLYRHLAEGVEDTIQPENQERALRARFVDQPHLRSPDHIGDNSHVNAGAVTAEEWRRSQRKR